MENQNEIKAANIIASWWKKIYDYKTQLWGESMIDNYCFEDNYDGMGNTDELDYVILKEERLMSQKYSDQHGTDYRFDDEDRFYDHNQQYDIFGSTMTASEYSDYVCANTPYEDEDFPNVQVYF